MKAFSKSAAVAALVMAFAAPSFGQSSEAGLRMPYQKEFWTTGHLGASLGRGKFDLSCPAGATCDDTANVGKAFAGGRFNNTFGAEASYLKTGDFDRSGPGTTGNVNLQALNFGLLAGIPFGFGMNSSVFGKLGVLWGHTEAGNASQNGWGPSFGVGALIGVNRSWALRLDWDRWRFKLPGGSGGDRENMDTLMVGVQYTLGNPR